MSKRGIIIIGSAGVVTLIVGMISIWLLRVPGSKSNGVEKAIDSTSSNDTNSEAMDVAAEPPPVFVQPANPETMEDGDSDGLDRAAEAKNGTDPLQSDTDQDYLTDGLEVNVYKTDPLKADTDGDGVVDGLERREGDPLDPKKTPSPPTK